MKGPLAWLQRRRGRNAAPVDGFVGPRTHVAMVGYSVARYLPELPEGMAWALEYVPDSTFGLSLYRDGRRTRLAGFGPLCELRVETVIAMARDLNRRREGGAK